MYSLSDVDTKKSFMLRIAENAMDYQQVVKVRSQVFGLEKGYGIEKIRLEFNANEFYVLCQNRDQTVGTITYQIGYDQGDISFEKYFCLEEYYKKYSGLLYCSRNAVLKEFRKSPVAYLLYTFILKICLKEKLEYVIMCCQKDNDFSIKLFSSMGFEKIGECQYGEIGDVHVYGVHYDNITYIYENYKRKFIDKMSERADFILV
jgi:hypothetical protein